MLVMELLDHWVQFPPTRILFRGFVGYKPPYDPKYITSREIRTPLDPHRGQVFVQSWGGKVLAADALPPWLQQDLLNLGMFDPQKELKERQEKLKQEQLNGG